MIVGAMVVTGVLLTVLPPGAAAAQPHISVVPTQPIPGQRVTVRGSGFCPSPCSAVQIAVDGSVAAGNVTVANDGTFTEAVALTPVSGTSTIVASQTDAQGGTLEATAIVHVVASDQTAGPPTGTVAPTAAPTPSPVPPSVSPTPPASGTPGPTTGAPSAASPTITASASALPSATSSASAVPTASPAGGPVSGEGGAPWLPIAIVLGIAAIIAAVAWRARRRRTA